MKIFKILFQIITPPKKKKKKKIPKKKKQLIFIRFNFFLTKDTKVLLFLVETTEWPQ